MKITGKRKVIGIALLAVVLMVTLYMIISGTGGSRNKELVVEVRHSDGTSKVVNISTTSDYLRAALEQVDRLVQGVDTEYGLNVTTVDGKTASKARQEYWEYTINGKVPVTGLDTQAISDGDLIVFVMKTAA